MTPQGVTIASDFNASAADNVQMGHLGHGRPPHPDPAGHKHTPGQTNPPDGSPKKMVGHLTHAAGGGVIPDHKRALRAGPNQLLSWTWWALSQTIQPTKPGRTSARPKQNVTTPPSSCNQMNQRNAPGRRHMD